MKIYMLGIAGVGMGNLACLLKQAGHEISGVDANVYPPMSDLLEREQIPYVSGYKVENIPAQIDVVVVGNVIRSDNVEVEEIKRRNLPMVSMPQAIQRYLLPNRSSIVIAGTHGKTTTSSLTAHCLRQLNLDPGFLIGGIANDLGTGSHLGTGKYFVLEGDEYDSAFFQKEPKFLSYQPEHLILTSVEFDHADIYKDLSHVVEQFKRVAAIVPKHGNLLVCSGFESALLAAKSATAPVYTYGERPIDDFQVRDIRYDAVAQMSHFKLYAKAQQRSYDFSIRLAGDYNVMNAAVVASLLLLLKIDAVELAKALASFSGVKRRQQVLFQSPDRKLTILEDFAHHPTAITVTLKALMQAYPADETWAVFEPRSNTTRRHFFQDSFPAAFATADKVLLYKVFNIQALPEDQRLNREKIQLQVQKLGKVCELYDDVQLLAEKIKSPSNRSRLVVIMTNGDFDGLKKLI